MGEQAQELVIEAPEDVVVATLPMLQGMVKAGDLLATLTSTRLKWVRSRLESAKEDLKIQERFFSEHRREALQAVLDQQVKSANESLSAAEEIFNTAKYLSEIGAMDRDDLPPIQKMLTPIQEKQSAAMKDQLTLRGKFADMESRLAITMLKLKAEEDICDESEKRLEIFAPTDGWFVASVGKGGFALSGNPLGSIHPGVTEELKQTLICAAPDDVTVSSLKVISGEVKTGQPIAMLSSSRIDRFKTQLHAANEDLEVQKRFFSEGRKDALEAILKKEFASATDALTEAKRADETKNTKFLLGLINRPERLLVIDDKASAEAQLASSSLDKEQFPNKVKDLQDRIANTAKRLKTEENILEELVGQLSFAAPAIPEGSKGVFVASAGKGGFVQCGDPIGVIHL